MSAVIVEEITDKQDFAALAPAWWELWRRCAAGRSTAATPFQTPAWLLSWWDAFAPGGLCVIALRRGERLVGLAPLYVEAGASDRRLLPVGMSVSDYLDVLIDDDAPGAGEMLMRHLTQACARWDSCELTELAPDSCARRLPRPAGCEETDDLASACPVLALPDKVDGLWQTYPPLKRRAIRMARNRASRRGAVDIAAGDAASHDGMLTELFRLHAARWQPQGEAGVLADARMRGFHQTAIAALAQADLARCYALSIAGETTAVYCGFTHGGRAYCYLTGFDPAYEFESPGTIVIAHAIEQAVREGMREFHFLRGRETYKYGWGAIDRWNRRRVFRRAGVYAEAS
jgi:CelD/BcsL family acetyltransferase involved in cellulose biosynthesis